MERLHDKFIYKLKSYAMQYEAMQQEETAEFMQDLIEYLEKNHGELKAYKDAEEQGLLRRLPVNIGETVWTNLSMVGWYFRKKDRPYHAKVVFIGLNNSDDMGGGFINVAFEKSGTMLQFNFSDIGKTVFLTPEEAEQALQALKEGAV